MTFEVNQNVQVLDINGIWRNAVVLSKLNQNRKHKIHFKNFSSRSDTEYSPDLMRSAISERMFAKSSLKCKFTLLTCLSFNDKIIYKLNDDSEEEIESKVFENDPFNCIVKVLDGTQTRNVPYEHIILTSKNPNFNKYLTKINSTTTTLNELPDDVHSKTSNRVVKKSTAPSSKTHANTSKSASNTNNNKSPNKSASKQNNKIYIDTAVDETNQEILIDSPLPSPKRIRLDNNTTNSINLNVQKPTVLLTALPNLSPTQIASIITSTPRTSASSTLSSSSGISSTSSIPTSTVNSSKSTISIKQIVVNNNNDSSHTVNTSPPGRHTQIHANLNTLSSSAPVVSSSIQPQLITLSPPAPPIQPLLQPFYISKSTSSNQQNQLIQKRTITPTTFNNVFKQTNIASTSNHQFDSKAYTDDLISKLTTRIDNLNAKVDLSELNKTLHESTEKITSSIDKLTNVINEFLKKQSEIQIELQSKLIELHVDNQKAISSLNVQQTITNMDDSNHANSFLLQQQSSSGINMNSNQLLSQKEAELLNPVVNPNNMEYITPEVINEIQMKSLTAVQFANNLMECLFKPEEYVGCNVNGRGVNRLDQKKPLDRKRMKYIELLTNKLYNPDSDIFLWPRCVKQMNRRILEICPQNKPKSQIATTIKVDRSI